MTIATVKTITAPRKSDGKTITCVLLERRFIAGSAWEDIDDYGVTYYYDMTDKLFVRRDFGPIL